MSNWKIRLVLLMTSLATFASVGGAVVRSGGFHW
jgi:hypothetical protein